MLILQNSSENFGEEFVDFRGGDEASISENRPTGKITKTTGKLFLS
jgi:hypothetical protein